VTTTRPLSFHLPSGEVHTYPAGTPCESIHPGDLDPHGAALWRWRSRPRKATDAQPPRAVLVRLDGLGRWVSPQDVTNNNDRRMR
jgi:hypothetical protein